MELNLIEILTLFGGFQGLTLGSVLAFSQKHRSLANRILAVFITLFSLHIMREIFETHGYMVNMDWLRVVSLTLVGYYGPLLYLYVKTLINPEYRLTFKHSGHFIIAGLSTISYSVAVFHGLTDWPQLEQYPWLLITVSSLQLVVVLQTCVYLALCFRWLKRYRVWLKDNISTLDQLGYRWLSGLLSGFLSLVVIWGGAFGADIRILNVAYPDWFFDLFWLVISLFIYGIGYYSLFKPEIITSTFKQAVKIRPADVLDKQAIKKYKDALIRLFDEEKVYLDPELTLQQLAAMVNINEKKLTQVINLGFEQTFYNLINQYRVNEVKRCLQLPQNAQSKLEVLAYEAGFKSASTFNRQFKNFTQMTPKAYREACVG